MADHLNPFAYLDLRTPDPADIANLTLDVVGPLDSPTRCLKALHALLEDATPREQRFLRGYLTLIAVHLRG